MQKNFFDNINECISERERKEPGFKQNIQKESQKLDLAIKIRNLREQEGPSQRELAERLGNQRLPELRTET